MEKEQTARMARIPVIWRSRLAARSRFLAISRAPYEPIPRSTGRLKKHHQGQRELDIAISLRVQHPGKIAEYTEREQLGDELPAVSRKKLTARRRGSTLAMTARSCEADSRTVLGRSGHALLADCWMDTSGWAPGCPAGAGTPKHRHSFSLVQRLRFLPNFGRKDACTSRVGW